MRLAPLMILLIPRMFVPEIQADTVPPRLRPNDVKNVRDNPGPGVKINYQTRQISRNDAAGRLLWTLTLKGSLGSHREPHVLHDAERVFVAHDEGVSAIDRKTGKVAWYSRGPGDRMLLSGKLLLATTAHQGDENLREGRWLVARAVETGTEVFKVALPAPSFDPYPIREVAGLFLVQSRRLFDDKGGAFLIDRAGKQRHHFGDWVNDGRQVGEDRIFLTDRRLIRMKGEKEVWAVRLGDPALLETGRLTDVPGGDLILSRHCPISDSGVRLMRIDPRQGKVVWEAECEALGVDHSKYRHQARAEIVGGCVKVTSRASGGSFVETLELKTGKQIKRLRSKSGD